MVVGLPPPDAKKKGGQTESATPTGEKTQYTDHPATDRFRRVATFRTTKTTGDSVSELFEKQSQYVRAQYHLVAGELLDDEQFV